MSGRVNVAVNIFIAANGAGMRSVTFFRTGRRGDGINVSMPGRGDGFGFRLSTDRAGISQDPVSRAGSGGRDNSTIPSMPGRGDDGGLRDYFSRSGGV